MATGKNMANIERIFEMQTPGQWKAFSHPLRLRILELLVKEASTNEELAAALGEQSGKLYFHTKKLLDAGLIVLDSTRQKGPITEKLYRAVARQLVLPTPVKGGKSPPLEATLLSGLALYRSAWEDTGGLTGHTELGYHLVLPLEPERRRQFSARLQALAVEFKDAASDAPTAEPAALTLFLHSFDRDKKEKDNEDALTADTSGSDPADRNS